MKLVKIFTEILKMKEKDKFSANYGIQDGFIYYMPDGHRIFKSPENVFLIDLKKALPAKVPINNPNKFFNIDNSELAFKTTEIKVIENGKIQVIKIANDKSYAWVNVKYLEYFEGDISFKISNSKTPVLVYEYDELVGLVLPVFIPEDQKKEDKEYD